MTNNFHANAFSEKNSDTFTAASALQSDFGTHNGTNLVQNATASHFEGLNTESELSSEASSEKTHNINEVFESEHPPWYKDALKDIAYYLRAHKFNEYDRRYNRLGDNVARTNFQYFPKPPLRSLHWEVHRYCEPSFLHCVDYLRKKLKHVALSRQDDTSIVAQENNWEANSTKLIQINEECIRMRKLDEEIAEPFEGPLERYQWRATASYFMCWFVMNEVPDLKHIDGFCDNFAYCLDNNTGPNNRDIRAVDKEPFACALYSFCPDPCCPNKHVTQKETCLNDPKNPCFQENSAGYRECLLRKGENKEFSDIILNRWNVSCTCSRKGFIWNSLYGICVDEDECLNSKLHGCNAEGEACLNTPGGFSCVCKWGYYYSKEKKKCMVSSAISKIKLNSKLESQNGNKTNRWELFVSTVLRIIGKPSAGRRNRISHVLIILGNSFVNSVGRILIETSKR
uniref:EGF-like domain-containing protein n=2 Tax=Dendroctonus ponderosae TaxID=77166 RepID=A0AAR5Q4Q1_DENPD